MGGARVSCIPSVHFQHLGKEPQSPNCQFRLEGLWKGKDSPGAFKMQTVLPPPLSSQLLNALECSKWLA